MLREKRRLNGFTLAEALIALAIVGVVAALTIPPLVKNTGDANIKLWKKYMSVIGEASLKVAQDYDLNYHGLGWSNSDAFKALFEPYLSYSKSCNEGSVRGECWHTNISDVTNQEGYPGYCGDSTCLYSTGIVTAGSAFIMSDGAYLVFMFGQSYYPPYCTTFCGDIIVDVNGRKGPNREGVDIFGGKYKSSGAFVPYGTPDNACGSNSCNGSRCNMVHNTVYSTMGCSSVVLQQ